MSDDDAKTNAPVLGAQPRRAPPRVDPTKLSQALQELFASWHQLLTEPFKGLTATGETIPDLFPLRPTGVSIEPMAAAAEAFLLSLDAAQRATVSFEADSEVWRHWSNIHRNVMRHGLCLAELSEDQRDRVFALVRLGLGARAFETVRNAMKLNEHLAELTGLPEEFGEHYYWISLFGDPSSGAPWGWQLDGHHCNVNCMVVGDQIVLSPMLLGSEPVRAESGVYAGITVLRDEEAMGSALMNALSPAQQKKATIGYDLPFDGFASGFKDNVVIAYDGLPVGDMTQAQRELLVGLIELYADRLPPGHAELRLAEARRHLKNTVFAWIGPFDPASPFYYRVYNPVIFIEFYHQPGVALPNTGYSRRHAHALVRTPNGNDYGRALLSALRPVGSGLALYSYPRGAGPFIGI